MTGFFVLSGFIMAHVYRETDFNKRDQTILFYWKRFAKIYPTYILATVVYFLVFPPKFSELPRLIVNDLLLMQGFFSSMFSIGLNGGTWSLTVEAFLYFLFPFLMILIGKSPKLLPVAIGIVLTISLNVYANMTDYVYANPVMRIGDFLCGMSFYFIKDRFTNRRFSGLLHIFTIVLLLIACTHLGSSRYSYMLGQGIIVPLFGLWITLLYHSKVKILDNSLMRYLGKISYSFYLWQFATITIGLKILKYDPKFNTHILVISGLFLTVMLSSLSYHFWEERWRRYIVHSFTKSDQVRF